MGKCRQFRGITSTLKTKNGQEYCIDKPGLSEFHLKTLMVRGGLKTTVSDKFRQVRDGQSNQKWFHQVKKLLTGVKTMLGEIRGTLRRGDLF